MEIILLWFIVGFSIFFTFCILIFVLNKYKYFLWFFNRKKTIFFPNNQKHNCYIIAGALTELSKKKIGALIVWERRNNLRKYASGGIKINSKINDSLIFSIFLKTSPLHDGAVIISEGKITYVSTYLPITKKNISTKYGARHRAAVGLSEISDCLCFIVSEKNGTLSFSKSGSISPLPKNLYELSNFISKLILQ